MTLLGFWRVVFQSDALYSPEHAPPSPLQPKPASGARERCPPVALEIVSSASYAALAETLHELLIVSDQAEVLHQDAEIEQRDFLIPVEVHRLFPVTVSAH